MERPVSLLNLNYMSYGYSEIENRLWEATPGIGVSVFFELKSELTFQSWMPVTYR